MTPKRGVSIPLLVVALLVVVGLVYVGYVQLGSWQRAQSELEAEQAALFGAQQRLASLKQLAEEEETMRDDLEFMAQLMPDVLWDENVIRDMQAGADLSDLDFIIIRFSDRARRDGYTVLPLAMTFEGSYYGLLNLLEYMGAYERAMRIEELRIGPGRDAEESQLVQANLRVNLFSE